MFQSSPEDVSVYERSIGSLVDPYRSGSVTDVVNAVTRETGIDAATWDVRRLLRMVGSIEQSAPQQPMPE